MDLKKPVSEMSREEKDRFLKLISPLINDLESIENEKTKSREMA